MKPVQPDGKGTRGLSTSDLQQLLKNPSSKQDLNYLVELLCDVANGIAQGRDLKLGLGKNKKTGQLYMVLNEGESANWANGSSFEDLITDVRTNL